MLQRASPVTCRTLIPLSMHTAHILPIYALIQATLQVAGIRPCVSSPLSCLGLFVFLSWIRCSFPSYSASGCRGSPGAGPRASWCARAVCRDLAGFAAAPPSACATAPSSPAGWRQRKPGVSTSGTGRGQECALQTLLGSMSLAEDPGSHVLAHILMVGDTPCLNHT